jgi:hypothetical protein
VKTTKFKEKTEAILDAFAHFGHGVAGLSAAIREVVNQFQYYQMCQDGGVEDLVVDARCLYEIADEIQMQGAPPDESQLPANIRFLQTVLEQKGHGEWRAFLEFVDVETNTIYRLRDYGTTAGEAADKAWNSFLDEDLRYFNIDYYGQFDEDKEYVHSKRI